MREQSKASTIAEVYGSLKQLIDAYERVMDTFGSVVEDVIRMKADIIEVEKFVNEQFADAVTGRNLWQANAKIHRETAEALAIQLQILADQGHKIEVVIPLPLKNKQK